MRTIAQLLGDCPVFAGLGDETLDRLAGCGEDVRFAAGERLFREGDPAGTFFVLRHGAVALEIVAAGRRPLVLETLHDGDVAGWSWLVPPYRSAFDARAVEATKAVAMDGACVRATCEADPALGYALQQRFIPVIVERLQATRLRLLNVYGGPHGG